MKLIIVGFGGLCCGCLLSQTTSEEEIGGPEQMPPAACLQMIKNTPDEVGEVHSRWCNTAPMWENPEAVQQLILSHIFPKQCWVCEHRNMHLSNLLQRVVQFYEQVFTWLSAWILSSLNPHISNLWHFPSLFTARKTVPVIFLSVSKIKAVEIPAECEGKSRRGQTTLTDYYTSSANSFSTLRATCGWGGCFFWQRRAEKWLWRLLMLLRSSWPFRWHVCWLLWKGQP